MARDVTKHGMSGYRAGCHCEVCRAAKREYMKSWRARRKAQAAGPPEPDQVAAPLREPVAGAGSLDMTTAPGPLEQAFLADLRNPDDKVAFRRHLVGIGRLNARVLDQIGTLDRLDLVSPVQLRQLEVLQRLAILGFAGMQDEDGDDGPGSVAADAAAMLAEIEAEANGAAGG